MVKAVRQCCDDYGHHPTEVDATIKAARAGWPDKTGNAVSAATVLPVRATCMMISRQCADAG